jgi:hypothetical protein
MHSLNLDECIEKLKRRELLREEILEAICELVKEVLMRESNVVHVRAPITVVGDIHGSFPLRKKTDLFLDNFMIYWKFSELGGQSQKRITCFWEIMWIEDISVSKRYHY